MHKKIVQIRFWPKIQKKNSFWRPGNANSKAIEAGYFQKKNLEEQLSKVAQEKWPKICPKKKCPKNMSKKKCPTEQHQNYGHQLWSMSKWPKQMPVDIGPYRVFQFLGQKNWTLLSMSIFCGILFGQTKTWPISMFTDPVPLGSVFWQIID